MWKTFLATPPAPCYVGGMENDQEQEAQADGDNERQGATDAPDMSRPGATEAIESNEPRLLTVKEAVALFNKNGISRSKKSIQRFCQSGALDCTRDPDQNRWYIEPGSATRLIGEIHDIQDRDDQPITPFSQDATRGDNGATDAPDMSRLGATNLKEESSASGPTESRNLTDKVIVEGLLAQLDAKDSQIEQLHILLRQAQEKIPLLQAGQGTQAHEVQEQGKGESEA